MREFKPGDKVIMFEYRQKNKWSPVQVFTEEGVVEYVKNGKVYVDSAFGVVPFDPDDVEYADVPF